MRIKLITIIMLLCAVLLGCENGNGNNNVDGKEIFTIGVFAESTFAFETENLVALFNEANEQYHAEIVYFPNAERLKLSFTSGNQPDVVNFDGYTLSDELLGNNGLMQDLYFLIDKDEQFNREDLVESYLTCAEQDGRLFSLAPSFNCRSLVAQTKIVGENAGWDMEEFVSIVESLPDDMIIMPGMTKSTMLQLLIEQTISNYVDIKNGTCCFTCNDFYALLELCDTYFPDQVDSENQSSVANGTALMETVYSVGGLSGLASMISGYNQTQVVTPKGYPGADGNGAVLYWYNSYGITKYTEHEDAAWAFIKWIVSETYQTSIVTSMPVSKAVMDSRYAILSKNDNSSELHQAKELVDGATVGTLYQSEIIDIVTEEAAAFFAHDISVENASDTIQTRVMIYLGEIT